MRILTCPLWLALSVLPFTALAEEVPVLSQDAPLAPPAEEPILEIPPGPSEASAPTVEIRRIANGDVIEEYRQGGRLTEIRVRPLRGPAYTVLDANGDGKLDRKDMEGPVAPIYWTLYEWD